MFADDRPAYVDLAVDKADTKSTIYEHPEIATFTSEMNQHCDGWRQAALAGGGVVGVLRS